MNDPKGGRPAGPCSTLDIRAILDTTANQILAVVAPDTARLVRAYVSLDEGADTAATDGVRIWVPPTFEGVDVTHDTPVAVGLLVHELGHFLQPLKTLEEAEQGTGAPHWLGNIVADVQLEAMMAGLFPPLADTLVAVRTTVKAARLAEYTAAILRGRTPGRRRLFGGAGGSVLPARGAVRRQRRVRQPTLGHAQPAQRSGPDHTHDRLRLAAERSAEPGAQRPARSRAADHGRVP